MVGRTSTMFDGHGLDALGVGDGRPDVELEEGRRPFEDVGQGQERQGRVVAAEIDDLGQRQDVAREIGVAEHDALGPAGRSRSIDDGGQVPGPDRAGLSLEAPGLLLLEAPAHLDDVREGVRPGRGVALDDDDALERGKPAPDGLDLAPQIEVRADDDLRAGVVDDVPDLIGGERGVDGDGDGSGREGGEVGHDPLRPVLGEDGDPVAGPDAEGLEPERQPPDGRFDLVRGDPRPVPVLLDHHPDRLSVGPAGFEEHAIEGGRVGSGHGGLLRGPTLYNMPPHSARGGRPDGKGRGPAQRSRIILMSSAAFSAKAGWAAASRARSRALSNDPAL